MAVACKSGGHPLWVAFADQRGWGAWLRLDSGLLPGPDSSHEAHRAHPVRTLSCLQAYAGKEAKLIQRFQELAMLKAARPSLSPPLALGASVSPSLPPGSWKRQRLQMPVDNLSLPSGSQRLSPCHGNTTAQPCGYRLMPLLPWKLPLL